MWERGDWERGDWEMAAELGTSNIEHQTLCSPKTQFQPINKKLFYQFGSLDKYYFIVF